MEIEKKTEAKQEIVSPEQPLDEVSHPLHSTWTLWYDCELSSGKRPSNWGSNLQEVYTFSTVEDFWRMYNNLPPAAQLQQGCGFNLFKKGIEPKWEDVKNAKGGKWTVLVGKKDELDKVWLWLMLACIGEVLEPEGSDDHVCGCVVNIRRGQNKLALWTAEADSEAATLSIGHKLKKTLEIANQTLGYTKHFSGKSKANKYNV